MAQCQILKLDNLHILFIKEMEVKIDGIWIGIPSY